MGLSVGPQSFAPITVNGDERAPRGQPIEIQTENPLDPLILALGRAVERTQTRRQRNTREGQN